MMHCAVSANCPKLHKVRFPPSGCGLGQDDRPRQPTPRRHHQPRPQVRLRGGLIRGGPTVFGLRPPVVRKGSNFEPILCGLSPLVFGGRSLACIYTLETRHRPPGGYPSAGFRDLHRQGPGTPHYLSASNLGSGSFGSQRLNGVLKTPGLKGTAK